MARLRESLPCAASRSAASQLSARSRALTLYTAAGRTETRADPRPAHKRHTRHRWESGVAMNGSHSITNTIMSHLVQDSLR